jgi:hypothetical protein
LVPAYRDGRTVGVAGKVHARWPFEELYAATGLPARVDGW